MSDKEIISQIRNLRDQVDELWKQEYGAFGNGCSGIATLVAGAVVVNTTKVSTDSIIVLTPQNLGTITRPVAVGVISRTTGVSFTIASEDATDTSDVGWLIIE